jgi:hypothetical protein
MSSSVQDWLQAERQRITMDCMRQTDAMAAWGDQVHSARSVGEAFRQMQARMAALEAETARQQQTIAALTAAAARVETSPPPPSASPRRPSLSPGPVQVASRLGTDPSGSGSGCASEELPETTDPDAMPEPPSSLPAEPSTGQIPASFGILRMDSSEAPPSSPFPNKLALVADAPAAAAAAPAPTPDLATAAPAATPDLATAAPAPTPDLATAAPAPTHVPAPAPTAPATTPDPTPPVRQSDLLRPRSFTYCGITFRPTRWGSDR